MGRMSGTFKSTAAVEAVELCARQSQQRTSYFWTTGEIARLKRCCSDGSSSREDVLAAVPGRSEWAIYKKAQELRLRWPVAAAQTSTPKERLDEELRAELQKGLELGDIRRLAERFRVPAWYVSRRAGRLGVAKPRSDREWSADEVAIVDRFGEQGPAKVHDELAAAGFERTLNAVGMAIKRRGVQRLQGDSLSARGVAELMGVDGKTVARWIEHIGLRARRSGDAWCISRKELRRWVLDKPDAFDIRKVNQVWFMGLMKGGGS